MSNDSSTGGYIQPIGTPPLEDAALDNFLQQVVCGITGLPGNFVFPRWQPNMPIIPTPSQDWASIGVTLVTPDDNAFEMHNAPLVVPGPIYQNGSDTFIRHEIMELLVSFYGPNARGNCSLFRDGLQVAQNREVMQLAGMGLVQTDEMRAVPSIVNEQWYYRIDMPLTIRREIVRTYPVLNILSSQITVKNGDGITVTVNP